MPESAVGGANEIIGGVANLSDLISKYGPLIVLLSIFLFIFIVLIVVMIITNYKMKKHLLTQRQSEEDLNEGIISKFVEAALGKYADSNTELIKSIDDVKQTIFTLHNHDDSTEDEKDYHKDIVGAYIDVNMAFKDASRNAMSKINSDRIAIYVFHNGNESLHGLPFFKMSCIHEWTKIGVNTLRGKSHNDMPLHLFNDFIEDLWKYGVYKAEDVNEREKIDPSIKEFIAYSNTASMYIVSIKDRNGSIAGFVVAEFDEKDNFEHDEARNATIATALDDMITTIAPIVTNRYNK